jgi:RND family efflux transporter MFP subunit
MKRAASLAAMVALLALAILYNVRVRSARASDPAPNGAASPVVVETCRLSKANSDAATRVISLPGIVRAETSVVISPKVPGRIERILVQEGDAVTAAQVLATLDLGDLAAQVDAARAGIRAAEAMLRKAQNGRTAQALELDGAIADAEGNLALAKSKLRQAELGTPLVRAEAKADADKAEAGVKQAEAGLAQAQAGLRQAEDTLKRLEFLYKHDGVAAVDVEGARSQAAIARAGYDTAKAALELARAGAEAAGGETPERRAKVSEADLDAARAGFDLAEQGLALAKKARVQALRVADNDVAAARAQLAQARAGYAQAVGSIGNGRLTSPISGVVSTIDSKVGEYAQPGIAIMHVVSHGPAYVEASAPTSTALAIRAGCSAQVAANTDPPVVLGAEVVQTATYTDADGRTVPVRLRLIEGDSTTSLAVLRPGMAVRVDIRVPTAGRSLIPYTAVRYEGSAASVFVVADGKARVREVTLGRTVDSRIEVLGGVSEGDRIIVSPPLSLRDGDAVKEMGQ